jgi:hypothetical protein
MKVQTAKPAADTGMLLAGAQFSDAFSIVTGAAPSMRGRRRSG